jgi:DNA-directed RNA polymerase subunit RPC12/RpoP
MVGSRVHKLVDRRTSLLCAECGANLERERRIEYRENEVDCPSCGSLCALTKPSRQMARRGAQPVVKIIATGSNAVHRMR